jgi:N-acyl-D-aspartate/D-glutamate deacylase
MKVALGFALAVCLAAMIAAVRFSVAADAAALAAPAPANAPVVQNTAPPKVLGHQIVSAFCTSFIARFSDAATTLHVDDQLLDDATAAETDYENDFSRLDGALRSWDHRLALIAALGRIMHTIPQTQAAVNDLRAQAAATSDAERRAALI